MVRSSLAAQHDNVLAEDAAPLRNRNDSMRCGFADATGKRSDRFCRLSPGPEDHDPFGRPRRFLGTLSSWCRARRYSAYRRSSRRSSSSRSCAARSSALTCSVFLLSELSSGSSARIETPKKRASFSGAAAAPTIVEPTVKVPRWRNLNGRVKIDRVTGSKWVTEDGRVERKKRVVRVSAPQSSSEVAVPRVGIEPTTRGFSVRCSTN